MMSGAGEDTPADTPPAMPPVPPTMDTAAHASAATPVAPPVPPAGAGAPAGGGGGAGAGAGAVAGGDATGAGGAGDEGNATALVPAHGSGDGTTTMSPSLAAEVAALRRSNEALTNTLNTLLPGLLSRFDALEDAVATVAQAQASSAQLLQRLLVSAATGGVGAGAGAGAVARGGIMALPSPATGPQRAVPRAKPAKPNAGTLHLWTGTWNMGNDDTLEHLDPESDSRRISSLLSTFAPRGYDVYVLSVQECPGDGFFAAFEEHTRTFMLPLNSKLYPAREDASTQVRAYPPDDGMGCGVMRMQ